MADFVIDVSGSGAEADGDTRTHKALFVRPWVWSPKRQTYVLPRSLRHETVDLRVAQLVEAMTAAGLTVEVVGADDRLDAAGREQARAEADERAVERHTARAERAAAEAAALFKRSDDQVAGIPFGQPVLAGHHSQRRHENALAKSHDLLGRGVQAAAEAKTEAALAAAAQARVDARRSPRVEFTRDDVKVGDLVTVAGQQYPVRRVNAKTVTVPWWGNRPEHQGMTGGHTDTVPYKKITAIHPERTS